MASIIALLANPFVTQFALTILEAFLSKRKADAETAAALQKIAQFLRENGVAKAKVRLGAEDQITEGDAMWNEKESVQPAPTEPKEG